jgi:hypothetical protein
MARDEMREQAYTPQKVWNVCKCGTTYRNQMVRCPSCGATERSVAVGAEYPPMIVWYGQTTLKPFQWCFATGDRLNIDCYSCQAQFKGKCRMIGYHAKCRSRDGCDCESCCIGLQKLQEVPDGNADKAELAYNLPKMFKV